jgi:hypothetical protein
MLTSAEVRGKWVLSVEDRLARQRAAFDGEQAPVGDGRLLTAAGDEGAMHEAAA